MNTNVVRTFGADAFLSPRQKWAKERFNFWVGECQKICPNMKAPRLEFSNKLTSTAGLAYYPSTVNPTGKVELSNRFVNAVDFDDTIAHEVAHICSVAMYGLKQGRGHGYEWGHIMLRLGKQPRRCHSYRNESVAAEKSFIQKV